MSTVEIKTLNGYSIEDTEARRQIDVLGGTVERILSAPKKDSAAPLALTEKSQPAVIWPEEGSLLRPVISMLPTQSGSGDPSPDNVRTISGRTAVTVTRCGKNLLDVVSAKPCYSSNVEIDAIDGGVRLTRIISDSTYSYARWNIIPIESPEIVGKTFTFSCRATPSGANTPRLVVNLQNKNGTNIGQSKGYEGSGNVCISYTIKPEEVAPGNRLVVVLHVLLSSESYGEGTYVDFEDVQFEVGAATEYEPYQGDTYSIDLGRTVYGGTLDVNTGLLTADRAVLVLDGATSGAMLTAATSTRSNFYYAANALRYEAQLPDDNNVAADLVSSHFEATSWFAATHNTTFGEIAMFQSGHVGFAYDGTIDEANAWLAAQNESGTPVQVCYKLAAPVTVQLTPVEIAALAGLNTVTFTGDEMRLTYNKSLSREHEEFSNEFDSLRGSIGLAGRKILVVGDSLSAADEWQQELVLMGATYANHALGGATIVGAINGVTNVNGTITALSATEVADKDIIIMFLGTNNMAQTHGDIGDLYPNDATVAGEMQYAINRIYALLTETNNLTCRLIVVTPFCFGESTNNDDAYSLNGAGLAQIIEDVANYNGVPAWNAYKNSGINPVTMTVWGRSDSDHLHLNLEGYKHLGKLIAKYVKDNTLA